MGGGEVSITVKAPPAQVWAIISDPTRTAEWSPECIGVEWVGADRSAVPGASFVGHNKLGSREWDMHCVIDTVDAEREFAFHTERNGDVRTRWGYRLSPAEDGATLLVEWWQRMVAPPPLARLAERLLLGGRHKHNDANLRASLNRIKDLAEA